MCIYQFVYFYFTESYRRLNTSCLPPENGYKCATNNEVHSDKTLMILVDSPKYIVLCMAQCNGHNLLVLVLILSQKERDVFSFPVQNFSIALFTCAPKMIHNSSTPNVYCA